MTRRLIPFTLAALLLAGIVAQAADQKATLSAADYTEIQMLYAKYNYAYDSSNTEMYDDDVCAVVRNTPKNVSQGSISSRHGHFDNTSRCHADAGLLHRPYCGCG